MRVVAYHVDAGAALVLTFRLAAWWWRLWRRIDLAIPVRSDDPIVSDDLAAELDRLPRGSVTELQIWGHGSPGAPDVARDDDTRRLEAWLQRIRPALAPGAVVWFRSCSVGAGAAGKAFASRAAEILGCTVLVHTCVIHAVQAGLHAVRPGQIADWPDDEGGARVWGWPWSRGGRWVLALRARVPGWAR